MTSGDAGGTARKRRLVAGRYELLFELARGGMGVVHVAKFVGAHGFDRLVAVKELLDPDDGPGARESFFDEARVTAKIHHPNVLPTLELFEHEGLPFIVMDLVRGVSLWQLLARLGKAREPPSVDLSAWIIMQAASGLHAAHELCDADGRPFGLVHRDVSPQNILLGFDGRVCVADFGIAKLRRATVKTESGLVKGKFAYMSPEQAQGWPLDRRSDVFSLGIVLHETLTGRRLFDHDSPTENLLHIVTHPIPTPRSIRPDVPEELSAIAMRCLAKSPDERFATADALSRALRSALRTRQANADDQLLREVLERTHAAQRDALTARLGALDAIDASAPQGAPTTTIVDAVPPVFTDGDGDAAAPGPAVAPAAPPAHGFGPPSPTAPVEIPLRRLPRSVSMTAIAVGALVLFAGAYGVVRWSMGRRADSSTESRAAAAPNDTAAVASASGTSPLASGDAREAPSSSAAVALAVPAVPVVPLPAPAPETAAASRAKAPQPRRPAVAAKPAAFPRAPDDPRPLPSQKAEPSIPLAAPSSSSSKGVPFRAF